MVFPIVGGTQDTGAYEISNSLRFEGSGAIGLARFGNNSRNGNTFTISAWIKRAKLGANTVLFNSKVEDSGVNAFIIMFESDDKISVGGQPASGSGAGGHRTVIKTNAVFRDPSAWYHMVYRQDTTQGTAASRHILYINGTATDNGTYAALDQNVAFAYFYNAGSYPFAIANDERDNSYGSFYIAEHHYTDGVSNGPDAFGETNNNGVWTPKQYTGSHGSYGHYLKFEQSGGGSGTTAIGGHDYTTGSSSTIGADSSGNDNHFHIQGYGTEDNTVDTPTNNFATLNPLTGGSRGTFSEGNVKVVVNMTNSVPYGQIEFGNFYVNKGKWYHEVKATAVGGGGQVVFGWNERHEDGSYTNGHNNLGSAGNVWYGDDGKFQDGSVSNTTAPNTYTDGDIIGIACDFDNKKFYAHKNGTYQSNGTGTGDPSNGTNGFSFTSAYNDFWTPWISKDSDNASHSPTAEFNFGNPSFSISSGNADANGYGNFEYAVPTGFYSLCTKNLAEYG